jgi:hypothetical protein
MRRGLAVLAVSAVAVAGASAAEAAVSKGSFAGKTSAGDPIGFRVDGKSRVYSFYFEGVTLKCSDGDSFDTPVGSDRIQSPKSVRFTISKDRRFGFTARDKQAGNGHDVSGRFSSSGNRTSGTLSIFARFDEQNHADPNGSVSCSSGKLKFSVKRR